MKSIFQPINCIIEPSFWHTLAQKKINDKMLDETPFNVRCFFQGGKNQGGSSFAFLNQDSFSDADKQGAISHFLHYTARFSMRVYLLNTKKAFHDLDRNLIMKSLGEEITATIETKKWLENPSLLLSSVNTIYGDLKKWQFYYCLGFPTPTPGNNVEMSNVTDFDDEINEFPNWVFALDKNGKSISISNANAESTFVVIDPSTHPDCLGWPTHIASIAISKTFGINKFNLIRLNFKPIKCVIEVKENALNETKFVGWKLNNKKPYFIDLSSTMDPMTLFTSASTLNLRLMKWRMSPRLNLDIFQNQRVLLIGCGTLGCNVSRILIGWGVRKFILIDYGKVSFSNPPRQSLYHFEDCLNGGKPKSEAAANELKRICPDVEVEFYNMEIPMPGHPTSINNYDQFKSNVEHLESLIDKSDTTFLLTDTRESRWLPTVICSAKGKLCISIALGFDQYSVVRSGSRNVGCYFCNDVIAPVDTMTNRTLDMQCTVTRPGIAPLASSIGVELWASVCQHKDGKDADGEEDSILGQIPHQIIGFIHNWQTLPMKGERFKCCVACSDSIISGYLKDGIKFIERAVKEPNFLEDVSGITQMKKSLVDEDCEWVDI